MHMTTSICSVDIVLHWRCMWLEAKTMNPRHSGTRGLTVPAADTPPGWAVGDSRRYARRC